MRFEFIEYVVRGGAEDAYEGTTAHPTGRTVDIPQNATSFEIVKGLKDRGLLDRTVRTGSVLVEGDPEVALVGYYVLDSYSVQPTYRPAFRLERRQAGLKRRASQLSGLGISSGYKPPTRKPGQDEVSWYTVATYVATYDDDSIFGEGACDVSVAIGKYKGRWYVRTFDDCNGSDDADDKAYSTENAARAAAERLAEQLDEGVGAVDAATYLAERLERDRMLGGLGISSYNEREQEVFEKVAARFPRTFGLRAFPGKVFRIGRKSSYFDRYGDYSEGNLMLYTQRWSDGEWRDFAKATASELIREVTGPLPDPERR